jgi:uroporphyrinogen decarboxylase
MTLPARIPGERHRPCFDNLLAVLRRERPDRPVLYELFLNDPLYRAAAGSTRDWSDRETMIVDQIKAWHYLGYDYANVWQLYDFSFSRPQHQKLQTISLNDAQIITDWPSFERYAWPDPTTACVVPDTLLLRHLPPGMKLVPLGPGGVLENVIGLVGFETLCYLIADDAKLAQAIFDAVGSRLLALYERILELQSVGAVVANDDWGFKTQPMLAPDDLRRFVFPWHARIVAAAHAAGKPVILHSCGNPLSIMEDVIEGMRFDGRHSYEDAIIPVEDAYERWGRRIATIGGIDVDFLCRATPAAIRARARAMLERTAARGGYALGSGNSIPEFVPVENYLAMLSAAWDV